MHDSTPDKAGQAGAEIEITPEMVAAGVAALGCYTSDEHRCFADEQIVESIFKTMYRHRRTEQPHPPSEIPCGVPKAPTSPR